MRFSSGFMIAQLIEDIIIAPAFFTAMNQQHI